jgi:hypothetical protein
MMMMMMMMMMICVAHVTECRLLILELQLPACGFRYGIATAANSTYMQAVEASMGR